jgi:hypothetical protein
MGLDTRGVSFVRCKGRAAKYSQIASDVISTLILRLAPGTGLETPLPFAESCCWGVGVTDPRSPFASVDMLVGGWVQVLGFLVVRDVAVDTFDLIDLSKMASFPFLDS